MTGPGNELLSDGTWNYTYDADGNTVSKVNIATGEYWTFSWNDANQLTLASDYDVHGNLIQSITFKYDVFGNMVEQDTYTSSNQTTAVVKYAYDLDGNIWADLNSSNQLVDRRLFVDINGQTRPLARIDASGNVSWYLTDHLGSIRLLMDNIGTVIDQIDYDGYGNITKETNAANGDRYKYASGQWNANLGMENFGLRWDNPANGSWLNADPSGLAAGTNPFDYVGNDPTNSVDPSGLEEQPSNLRLRNGTPTLSLAAAGYQSCVLCHGHPSLGWVDVAAFPTMMSQVPLSQHIALASEPLKLYDQLYGVGAGAFGRMVVVDGPAVVGSGALTLERV